MRRASFLAAVVGSVGVLALAGSARAELLFERQANALGAPGCQQTDPGCWTNYTVIADLDGDGALDVIFPNSEGFFGSSSEKEPLYVFKGNGSGQLTNVSSTAVGGFQGNLRQVAIGDVDGDGDLDMYAPDAQGNADKFFINQGGFVFADEAASRIGGLASHSGATRFGDVDNDGDLDLIVTQTYAHSGQGLGFVYKNDGTGHFTVDATAFPNITPADVDDIDLADFNGDFALDILVNAHAQNDVLLLNDGGGKFTVAPFPAQASSFHYNPGVCDVNGDGALDVLIDNTGGSMKEQLLLNNGDGTFTNATAQIANNPAQSDDNGVNCIDFDGDGDLDIVVEALTSNGERVYTNDGAGNFALVSDAFTKITDGTLWMDFGDLNGDGRLDAVSAQGEGDKDEQVYFGTAAVAIDMRAPKVIAQSETTTTAAEMVVRFRLSDNAVTDVGPRLQRAWLKVGLAEIDAKFVGGDVFRAVIPAGAAGTAIQVCATDRQGNTVDGCGGENPASTSSSVSTGAAMSTSGTSMSSTGASMGTGTGGGGGDVIIEDGGCGCRVGATEDASPWLAIVGGAIGLVLVGRRRRARR